MIKNLSLKDLQPALISLVFVFLGVASRLLPHHWNTTPLIAIILCAGVYLGIRYSVAVLFFTMLISDFFIGFYDLKVMTSVYGSFVLIAFISFLIKKYNNTAVLVFSSIGSSLLFFLITNWAVWQFSGMYTLNFNGLIGSYIMAIPFFKNAIVGDLIYTVILFKVYKFAINTNVVDRVGLWVYKRL